MADSWRDFACEHCCNEFVAAWFAKHKRSSRHEMAAARQQDDVFQEFQSAGAAAVLIVDFAVDVIRVGEINQLGAGLEVAVIPAVQTHPRRGSGLAFGQFLQILQHKLAGIEAEALFTERDLHWSAEGHKLCFNARKLRNSAHGEKHFVEQALPDGGLRKLCGNIEAADKALLLFEDVKGVARGVAIFESDTA